MTPFFVSGAEGFVPNEIAHGGWGPTLGGQVVGGLLARAVEGLVTDDGLHPARFTVEILRRVRERPGSCRGVGRPLRRSDAGRRSMR